jgi:lipid II:glycine glycyltransferase (peptidoglycan interpeptide bridge formation enzyme)
MQVAILTDDRREEWNTFVAQQPAFALLQAWEWGEFKEKLGWQAFRVALEDRGQIVAGAQMLVKALPLRMGSIAYIPRGPIGDWLADNVASCLLTELHRVAQEQRAIFLKIEPPLLYNAANRQLLECHHFQASQYTNQPQATIVIDLKPKTDDILLQIPRQTRYNIRYGPKQGVTVRVGSLADLPTFHNLMQLTGRRGQFAPRVLEYYEQEWQTYAACDQVVLLMAYYQDALLAVRTAFRFGQHAADFHASSSNEHRNLRPNHLLVWEAIKWAKEHDCQTYDLWGIPNEVGQLLSEGKPLPEEEPTDGLWGVYQFKRSFCENVVCYVGAYDYVYSPLLYASITNKFLNADTLDRIATWMDALRTA